MRRPGDPSLLDLDREEHLGPVREALLFCCLDDRPVEKRIADAIDALRTCARWFPVEKDRVATHCSGCGTTLDGSYCPQCEPPDVAPTPPVEPEPEKDLTTYSGVSGASAHMLGVSEYQGKVLQALQKESLTLAELRAKVGGSEHTVRSAVEKLQETDAVTSAPPPEPRP